MSPENWGALGPRPFGWGLGWLPKNKSPPHMCYHVKFGSSASKDMCINRRNDKIGLRLALPPCNKGVANLEIRPSPTCAVILPNLVVLGQTVHALLRISDWKKWLIFCRQAPPFKVIRTDTDRSAIYDFLLTFHSNNGPLSYRFRDKLRFQSTLISPSPCVFNTPLNGFPLEFGNDAPNQKN